MLNNSFQKLSKSKRKQYYYRVVELFNHETLKNFPNLMDEVNEGNEHKVGVIRSVINTKIGTNMSWEDCMAAVDNNI